MKYKTVPASSVRRLSIIFAGSCLLAGLLVVIGWTFDVDVLRRPLSQFSAMNPTSALCFVLLSLSLFFLRSKNKQLSGIARLMILLCLTIALSRLLELYLNLSVSIDQLIFPEKLKQVTVGGRPNGISPNGALNLGLTCIALLTLALKRKDTAQWIALVIGVISWFAIMSYLYRVPEFYGAPDFPYHPIAPHAAFCFFLLAAAILTFYPDRGISKMIFGPYQGSEIARLLFPVVFLVPLVVGYIRLLGHWNQWYSTEFGVAILVSTITLIVLIMVFRIANILNRRSIDQRRDQQRLALINIDVHKKNDEINALNEEFAATNEELTASNEELTVLNEQLHAAFDTIREQSETILKQKDEQLNRVLDSSMDAIWSIDLTGNGENYMSRSGEKIFGEPITEAMIKNPEVWAKRVHPEDREIRETAYQQLRETGSSDAVYRMRTASGTYRWLRQQSRLIYDENKKPVRFEGIVADMTDYKTQEFVLNQYRENLDIIFNNTVEEILLLDASGKVVLFNRALEKFLTQATGNKPEVGKYVWDTTSKDRSEASKELFRRALNGESLVVDAVMSVPSTGEVVHELRYEPVFIDGTVKYVTIISVDVTEKKNREALLRKSETNLRAIFENTKDAFTLLDKHFNIVMFNTSTEHIVSRNFKVGSNVLDFVSNDRQELFRTYLEKAQQGESVSYETKVGDRPEDMIWYFVTVSPVFDQKEVVGYCITTHNHTAIKRAEFQLKASEERFRALIENSKDIIALTDYERQVLYVNSGVENITGYSPEEFLKLKPSDHLHPDDARLYIRFLKEVTDHPGKLIEVSFRAKHKNGSWQWLEGTAIDLSEHESIKGIVLNFRDVTQRKKSEQERTDLLAQLIEQNNDLRQFSFIASHNLRGPVASLLGLFNLLDKHALAPEPTQLIEMAMKAVTHLDSVIRDLTLILELRSNRLNAKEYVSIGDTIEKISLALQMQIEQHDVTINVDTSKRDSIHTIRSYFYSILVNLISNAIKYRSPHRRPKIEIRSRIHFNDIEITVRDNGIGINLPQFQDRLFGLYQRFHLQSEGRGIGLYMVRTQVHLLNGTISVESQPEEGTVFTLRFPTAG